MSQASDLLRQPIASVFDMFAETANYSRPGGGAAVPIKTTIRSMKADELFGSAAQGDRLAVFRYEDFTAAGFVEPQRYDRITVGTKQYSAIEWRPAPAAGTPVFYRVVIRGGQQ